MTELELVLREVSLLRSDLRSEIHAERDFREELDKEVSDLRIKVDRLERPHVEPPTGVSKRDGGLVLSSSAITGIVTALMSMWMNRPSEPTPPAPPQPAPTHLAP